MANGAVAPTRAIRRRTLMTNGAAAPTRARGESDANKAIRGRCRYRHPSGSGPGAKGERPESHAAKCGNTPHRLVRHRSSRRRHVKEVKNRRRHEIRYGTHEKLAASFGSPVPLYRGTVGYGHRGRVKRTARVA